MKTNMKPYFDSIVFVIITFCMTSSLADVQPSTIMGLDSGKLLKCNFQNLTDCTSLIQLDSSIYSLAVSGEFLYVGTQSGELRRCRLAKPENCILFHTFLSEINALAIDGKYIYAGSLEGITKCGLRKSDDCSYFSDTDTPVRSLAMYGRRLFGGTDGAVFSCSLDSENCTELANTTSAVRGLTVSANTVYVGLQEGKVQNCDLEFTDCATLFDNDYEIKALEIFGQYIQVGLDSKDIVRYVVDGSNETEIVGLEDSVALSLTTMFETTGLKHHYIRENSDCAWQFRSGSCPPFIIYYDIESRAQFELHVKDDKLHTATGTLFDTNHAGFCHSGRGAIFVMDPVGRIYASNTHPILLLHHSSLMAGDPVASAGELVVNKGVLEYVTSCSGHYRPNFEMAKQIKESLRRQGYTKNVTVKNCWGMSLMIDLDYKKTDLYYRTKYAEYALKVKSLDNN